MGGMKEKNQKSNQDTMQTEFRCDIMYPAWNTEEHATDNTETKSQSETKTDVSIPSNSSNLASENYITVFLSFVQTLLSMNRSTILNKLTDIGRKEYKMKKKVIYNITTNTKPKLTVSLLTRIQTINGKNVSKLSNEEKNTTYHKLIHCNPVEIELLDTYQDTYQDMSRVTAEEEKEETKEQKDKKETVTSTTTVASSDATITSDATTTSNSESPNLTLSTTATAATTTTTTTTTTTITEETKETTVTPFAPGIGDWVDCQDAEGHWWISQIIDVSDKKDEFGQNEYKIRLVDLACPPSCEEDGSTTLKRDEMGFWEWENTSGEEDWRTYEASQNLQMEQAYQQGEPSMRLGIGEHMYEMTQLQTNNSTSTSINGVQTNINSGQQRRIRRVLTAAEIKQQKKKKKKSQTKINHPN